MLQVQDKETLMFDKIGTKKILDQIGDELQPLAAKLGIHIETGNARYSSTNITLKLNISTINAQGRPTTKEVSDFKELATRYGLSPDDLYKQFDYLGKRYEIVGCKPRSYKYPLVVRENKTGKQYKFSAYMVKTGLEMEKK